MKSPSKPAVLAIIGSSMVRNILMLRVLATSLRTSFSRKEFLRVTGGSLLDVEYGLDSEYVIVEMFTEGKVR